MFDQNSSAVPFNLDTGFRMSLPDAVADLEKRLIQKALDYTHGNQKKASKLLGITERMIGYKLKRYGFK